jgi:chloramphenicol-sensitive protein RarD
MHKGILFGISAYLIWGFFPIMFKSLQSVPPLEIVYHRVVWSFILLITITLVGRSWNRLKSAAKRPKVLALYSLASLLLAINWLVYVYGVNSGHIVETSLGYFINPLVSVALGVLLLREKLRPLQWVPVALAVIGVIYLTALYAAVPWIALTLAFSFGTYGLIKKIAPLGSLDGLTLETAILFLPSLALISYMGFQGRGSFVQDGISTSLLLILVGVITAIPLLLFASAARLIPLSYIGLLQYIAPTCQFLLGVFLYQEPFTQERLVGFVIIWIALLIFTLDGFRAWKRPIHAAKSEASTLRV